MNLLLDNSWSSLNVKPLNFIEKWRKVPKLKMAALNHIKHNPIEIYALPLAKKTGNSTSLHNWCRVCQWSSRLLQSRNDVPQAPCLLRTSRTFRCIIRWFPAILMSLKFSFKVRLLCWRYATRIWHRTLWTLNQKPVLNLAFPPLIQIEAHDKPEEGCCWVCTRIKLMQT